MGDERGWAVWSFDEHVTQTQKPLKVQISNKQVSSIAITTPNIAITIPGH